MLTSHNLAIDSVEKKIFKLTANGKSEKYLLSQRNFSSGSLDEDDEQNNNDESFQFPGLFPSVQDDDLSLSSDEERDKRDRLQELSKLAAYSAANANVLKDLRLPLMNDNMDFQFDIDD